MIRPRVIEHVLSETVLRMQTHVVAKLDCQVRGVLLTEIMSSLFV